MYSGPIIDPHQHFWDIAQGKHPWLAPREGGVQALGGLDKLRRSFMPADYLAATAGQNVVATVHIEALWQPGDELGETAWLESIDKPAGTAARYIAAVPFGAPDAAAQIAAQAACARMRGVRAVLSYHPGEPAKSFAPRDRIAFDPAWRRDVARLHGHGLTLELMMYPYQLDGVLDLARSLPELQIVVNHCASPIDRDDAGLQRWRDAVRALAACPNIVLKVSNAGAYDTAPTEASIAAVLRHCIDWFGPQRAMFASDWPVLELHTPFAAAYDAFRRVCADLPAADQRALFHDTARRIYRL